MATIHPILCSLEELDISLPDDIRSCLERQYQQLYEAEVDGNPAESAQRHVSRILQAMKKPQAKTTCRVNRIVNTREELVQSLNEALSTWAANIGVTSEQISITPHAVFDDVVSVAEVSSYSPNTLHIGEQEFPFAAGRIPPESPEYPVIFSSWPRRKDKGWPMTHRVIICDRFCGEAVLRGSDIFVRGVICADAGIEPGEQVAIYAHLANMTKQQMQRGQLLQYYVGKCVFLGLGTAVCSRADIFRADHGLAVRMSVNPRERVGPLHPPFHGILSRDMMLQNLPSVLVGHALNPQPGDVILDMCAAPGGKTAHLASLVRNQAIIIACDKSRRKMLKAKDFFLESGATCITPLALDSTKCIALSQDRQKTVAEVISAAVASEIDGLLMVTSFPPESFDRILLDPPCSALGLRPKLQVDLSTLKDLEGYPKYQRMFVKEAIALLKPGGTMTYSTCTIHAHENEGMVRHILDEYPCMQLLPIEIDIGLVGLPGIGLNDQERMCVRRFDPSDALDTMGFFVAKFSKQLL